MKEPRVFIGLREISGYFGNLKQGFDEIGVDAVFLNLGGNHFNYTSGKNPLWVEWFNFIGSNLGAKFSGNFILRFLWLTVFQNIFSLLAFFISIFRYDTFILGGNSTFFYFLELPILKLFGKKIIYVFLGTDSRPIYMNGYVCSESSNFIVIVLLTRLQKLVVNIIEYFADVVINHPPQAHFHKEPFLSMLQIGLPYSGAERGRIEKEVHGEGPIKIIHIPSKAGPKGSIKFREIIDELKLKYEIDYTEISGIPHDEVLKIIAEADIALDEMYSDTPLAVFATECAFHSVPIVVGSYYVNNIKLDYEEGDIPPSEFTLPDELKSTIEKLIVDEDYRLDVANKLYQFVSTKWKSSDVAQRYLKVIKNDIEPRWYYDPNTISYYHGCGLEEYQVVANLNAFLNASKANSLLLKDKPLLVKSILQFLKNK